MAQIELGFAIISSYFTMIDTDDYDLEPGEWEKMTIKERIEWIKDHEFELKYNAKKSSSEYKIYKRRLTNFNSYDIIGLSQERR